MTAAVRGKEGLDRVKQRLTAKLELACAANQVVRICPKTCTAQRDLQRRLPSFPCLSSSDYRKQSSGQDAPRKHARFSRVPTRGPRQLSSDTDTTFDGGSTIVEATAQRWRVASGAHKGNTIVDDARQELCATVGDRSGSNVGHAL